MRTAYGKQLQAEVLNRLEVEGKRIIQECVDERTYEHQTHNLYDSYGYGIYVNGSLTRFGYLSAAPLATQKPFEVGSEGDDYGRVEIRTFLAQEFAPSSIGIDMVIAAAMPYAEVLEEGNPTSNKRKKFKVISMAFDKLKAVSKQFKGSSVKPLNGGKI